MATNRIVYEGDMQIAGAEDDGAWEDVSQFLRRLPVPGGWIYVGHSRTQFEMVFVPLPPDPSLSKEQRQWQSSEL